MSEIRELSFCELRQKDIVSIHDGRKLGRLIDLVFSPSGKVKGIVAPYGRRFLFFRSQEVYIPYTNIKTIGEDIILVDVDAGISQRVRPDCRTLGTNECEQKADKDEHNGYDCDGRCDKCMLFDCENRWKKGNGVYIHNAPYK